MFALLLSLTAAADAPAALTVGVHQGAIGPGGTVTFSVPLVAGERISLGTIASGAPVAVALAPPSADPTQAKTDPITRRLAPLDDRATVASTYVVTVTGPPATPFTLVRRHTLTGTPCDQLAALEVPDPWALDGVDAPGASATARMRELVAVLPWADACVVQRLQIDLGPSCTATRATEAEARALYTSVAKTFRACHDGWWVGPEDDPDGEGVTAERGDRIRFLRVRAVETGAWQVSTGTIPPM
ncbi:MAG: hypothetical protein ACI8PZ_005538 [Myxococcota bacterium]|jgi:hypothetical protein